MPKGVEHYSDGAPILGALFAAQLRGPERRSARPRRSGGSGETAVPKSEMPKGVEHVSSPTPIFRPSSVPQSEMPKGVEHSTPPGSHDDDGACHSQRCRKALSTSVRRCWGL